jgi:outer membrane protein OmpA-like peptidoglycan-associated protein
VRRPAALFAVLALGLTAVQTPASALSTQGPDGVVRGELGGDPARPGDLPSTILEIDAPTPSLVLNIESLDGSIGVRREEGSTTVTLAADVLFAFDSATLSAAAKARIAETAKDLRADGATGIVRVAGHTDHVGTERYNRDLSLRRARAVAAALQPLVADLAVTLQPRGYGWDEPLVEETKGGKDDPKARARNRRVEISSTPAG